MLSVNKEPIFILGCSRTGSKIYKNFLNQHPEIAIAPEIHFLDPAWLHKSFVNKSQKIIKDLNIDENVAKLVDLMFLNYFYGSFWNNLDFDKQSLLQRILESDRSFKSIFYSIILEYASSKSKNIPGAKFPVHFSYLPTLLDWFPESKIVYTVRDPRAIFASQFYKLLKRKNSYHTTFVQAFCHIIIQAKWSLHVYKKHMHRENIYLAKYEDFVTDPEFWFKDLFSFLNLDYDIDINNIRTVDSSYNTISKTGISTESINRWNGTIPTWSANLISSIIGKDMSYFNWDKY